MAWHPARGVPSPAPPGKEPCSLQTSTRYVVGRQMGIGTSVNSIFHILFTTLAYIQYGVGKKAGIFGNLLWVRVWH